MSEGTKQFLIIINDRPYENERPYNALQLAMKLSKRKGTSVRFFKL